MNTGKQVSLILLVSLGLIASKCGPIRKVTPIGTETAAPASISTATPTPPLALTATFTSTLTPTSTTTPTSTNTPTSTVTPTNTLTPKPTLYITFTATQTPLPSGLTNLPTILACVPDGNISCEDNGLSILGVGSCTLRVCTDSCGNVTSETTLGCG